MNFKDVTFNLIAIFIGIVVPNKKYLILKG